MSEIDKVALALINSVANERYGLRPYNAEVNKPVDVGLGGPSTEYLVTDNDQLGTPFNYPSIWWDYQGSPALMNPDDAYDTALGYERLSGLQFPRFDTTQMADYAAQARSEHGGGDVGFLPKLPFYK